jgi:hypothetical protein
MDRGVVRAGREDAPERGQGRACALATSVDVLTYQNTSEIHALVIGQALTGQAAYR